MTPWQWWAGSYGDVEYEDTYTLGEFKTRAEAVAAARVELPAGEIFYVIEARSSTDRQHKGADMVPFVRTRNRALLKVPGKAVA